MSTDRRLAGIGGIVFTVFLVAGFFAANPTGGDYDAADVADFVAKGHRSAVVISIFLVAISVVGLLVVMAYLCDTSFGAGRHGRIAWGTSLLAAASFLIGWIVLLTPSVSVTLGGGPGIEPAISYTIMQAGFGIFIVVSGLLLGISFLTLAIGGQAAPMWVRAFMGLVGLLALFSFAFFPFWSLLLWGLVIGIWLLLSSPEPDAPTATPQTA